MRLSAAVVPSLLLLSSLRSANSRPASLSDDRPRHTWEMIAPLGSTTTIMCEPAFNEEVKQATWYRDGRVVGHIDAAQNIVLHNRTLTGVEADTIPDVGFLIITNVSREDEGKYWCETSGEKGEITDLIVAYIEEFMPHDGPLFVPKQPKLGQDAIVKCVFPSGYPSPSVSWLQNGDAVKFSDRIKVAKDGSLMIRRFSESDYGIYECVASNIAGRRSASTAVEFPGYPASAVSIREEFNSRIFEPSSGRPDCPNYILMRNGMLWFLVGCLATGCIVLIYLLFAMVCLRPTRRRQNIQPGHFLRSHPSLAPGFRKLVVPTPNVYVARP